MRKTYIIIAAALLLLSSVTDLSAVPARRRPVTVAQPDGTSITIRRWGDEFHHWVTDTDGNRLIRDDAGFWRIDSDDAAFAERASIARSKRAMRAVQAPSKAAGLGMGDKHFLVVLVQFSDVKFTVQQPQAAFTNLLNQAGYSANGGTGSARDYYIDNSNGRFRPTFDVVGPVTVPNRSAYYGQNDSSDEDVHPALAFVQACSQLDAEIDFSRYDLDNDGRVDNVFFYYAGHNEAEDGGDSTIWPHKWDVEYAAMYDNAIRSYTFDGVKLSSYACTSELSDATGSRMCGIGTFCHEFGHVIGLPDMYDIDYEDNGEGYGLLNFSLMDSGSYNNEGRTPPYLTSIEREMLGWMTIQEWTEPGAKTIEGVQNDAAYMTLTENPGEYFVYECRNGLGWDAKLIDDYEGHDVVSKGLIIYHVDKSSNKVYGKVTAKDCWDNEEINMYGAHQCLDIVKATPKFYYYEEVLFGDITGVREFNSGTTPAAVDWAGRATGHGLYDIRMTGDCVTLTYKKERTDALYKKGICAIANPGQGSYRAGSDFALELLAGRIEPVSVVWYLDGAEVSGTTVVLSQGEHVIEAHLTFPDGSQEVLEQSVIAG